MNNPEGDKIWVTISRTVNLGNYENIKIDMGESLTILPEDNPKEVRNLLCKNLLADIKNITDTIRQKIREEYKTEVEELRRKSKGLE